MAIINFASENYSGAHPDLMAAITNANTGVARSYGSDDFTKEAAVRLSEVFGLEVDAYFTFNGTGANVFGLGAITERFHSIFCSDVAHIYVDESTAPESFTNCRIYPVKSESGKIDAEELRAAIKRIGDIHHPQPRVVSITQPTEYGTVYKIDELKAIKAICQENDMLLHVDGARYFNAADHLGATLKEMTTDVGIDVLTLGGTKAGMLFGESVIFFNPDDTGRRKYNLKRSMQLASKNRFIAAQFTAILADELWKSIAKHTNNLAKEFEKRIADIPSVEVAHPVETNAVFLKMDPQLHEALQEHAYFYAWNEAKQEVRLVFSFDNTLDEIEAFVELLKKA